MKTIDLFSRFAKKTDPAFLKVAQRIAVVYTRVSSKEQAENNLSLEFQRKTIEEYAKRNDYRILEYFGGTYESAKTDGRKEFKRMLDYIKKYNRKITHVLVYATDRFSRTGGGAIKLAQDLREKYGVSVFAITQPTDTSTPNGVFQQNIQLLFSEFDNQLRRQRAVASLKEKFEQGDWCARIPPGYSTVRTEGIRKIVVNETGRKLKKAFEWKAEGMKNEEILLRLKRMGWKIYPQKLSRAFSNPFYCGIVTNVMLNGKVVEGKHEKLISPELFLKVNGIRAEAQGKYGVKHEKETDAIPLKLFMKCHQCGEGYTGYKRTKKKRKNRTYHYKNIYYYYKCRTVGCRCNKNANSINEQFANFLSTYTIKPEYIAPFIDCIKVSYNYMTESQRTQEKALKDRLEALEKDIDVLEEKYYVKEQISGETFQKFHTKYVEERDKIVQEMPKTPLSISNLEEKLNQAVAFSSKLNTVWSSSSFSQKERIQKLIFPQGVVYDFENEVFRTQEVNLVFHTISYLSGNCEDSENENGSQWLPKIQKAEREGFEPPDL
jgi:site-specific DNA recombinase